MPGPLQPTRALLPRCTRRPLGADVRRVCTRPAADAVTLKLVPKRKKKKVRAAAAAWHRRWAARGRQVGEKQVSYSSVFCAGGYFPSTMRPARFQQRQAIPSQAPDPRPPARTPAARCHPERQVGRGYPRGGRVCRQEEVKE